MPDREAALAAVRQHLERAVSDPVHLLGAEAMDAAHALADVTAPERDLAAAHALGWYRWVRHLVLPEGHDRDDLAAAVPLLALVYRTYPQSTPESLRGTLQQLVADSPVLDADDSAAAALHGRVLDLLRAYERTQQREMLEQAVSVMRTLIPMLPEEHPARAAVLNSLGFSLRRLVDRGGDAGLLDEAVRVSRQAVAATPTENTDRVLYLNNLGSLLRLQFERSGKASLLEEAVEVGRRAVAAALDHDVYHAMCLRSLDTALRLLFEQTAKVSLLAEAVEVSRQAVALTPDDHPDRAGQLGDLGIAVRLLFEQTAKVSLLAEAVEVSRQAVAATPDDHPDRAGHLSNLEISLHMLFEQGGGVRVLEEAVEVGRQAVAATPDGHPDRAARLTNLGIDLQALFEHTSQLSVLKAAVTAGREAVAITPDDAPDRAVHLNPLGASLRFLFEHTDAVGVLEEAVQVSRQAVAAAPHDHPDRAMYLNNLGGALQRLFERTNDAFALQEAVQLGRQAVTATPDDHPKHAMYLSNLGFALQVQFERTGEMGVLEEAVQMGRQAMDATPDDHPNLARYLNNLGLALRVRFERTGEITALQEAVQIGRQVAIVTPDDHSDRAAALSNLANALRVLFERTGEESALEEAVRVSRQAVHFTPDDHPHLPATLTSLRNALQRLAEHTGEVDVLEEAVRVSRQAVAAAPHDHPDRAMYLNNLGIALQRLFEHTTQLSVLEEAVQSGREAVAATPDNHPDRASYLNPLGKALQLLSERTRNADLLAQACACYREAADTTTGETMSRIRAYRSLALLASGPGAPQAALKAVEDAIDLVGTLAPGSLARADREHQLSRLPGLAGEAAAAALGAGRPVRAVELMERARGILTAETLGIRGRDTARLREHAPHLADEFDRLRARLDTLNHPRSVLAQENTATEAILAADRRLAEDRRATHAAWQSLLARIRGLPEFEDFLQAPPIDRLTQDAHDGPIVFITTSPSRCDALILADTRDSLVQAVPLTSLTHELAVAHADRLQAAVQATTDPRLAPRERATAQQEILAVLAWLWDTVTEPVLTQLGHTAAPRPGAPWHRLWWCPVGVLSAFPLHAAGHHADAADRPGGRRTVFDRVVSSYATTVRALAHARTRHTGPATPSTLIVPAADAPGSVPLPGVRSETRALTHLIPDAHLLDPATRATVLRALPGHRVAHFSCHGYADWNDPARSRLVLPDHATTPLTLADITALDLTADLAYLSACDTSVTDPRLVDESLHITGAFHLAGYQQVIGTLWPVDDRTAAEHATDFYTRLTNGGTTPAQTHRSAHALHHATTRLRDRYPNAPSLWAAYTHTGR
ncbi:CHAT domain-containing protein [Streptomyces sp. NPDC097610]|uniref:CHAT domain-containing protein n=1 Tax=Streptomyces sp. NPDC097610 TaxID=3157227 RepID=UPI003322F261